MLESIPSKDRWKIGWRVIWLLMHDWRWCVAVAASPIYAVVTWLLFRWIIDLTTFHPSQLFVRVVAVSTGVVIWGSVAALVSWRLLPGAVKVEVQRYRARTG
jgi:hypothetical protein